MYVKIRIQPSSQFERESAREKGLAQEWLESRSCSLTLTLHSVIGEQHAQEQGDALERVKEQAERLVNDPGEHDHERNDEQRDLDR